MRYKQMIDERGSSSVMVILIIFTLMVFGIFALMSSYSEYKLSKKYASWIENYYALDDRGISFLEDLDSLLDSGSSIDAAALSEGLNAYDVDVTAKDGSFEVATVIRSVAEDKQDLEVSCVITGKEYKITKWKQTQSHFIFEDTQTLWDGN